MASPSPGPNFRRPIHPASSQVESLERPDQSSPLCTIYSKHPLALRTIKDAVCSEPGICRGVSLFSLVLLNQPHRLKNHILILDTCSVENWAACLDRWRGEGGQVITLVSTELGNPESELHMLKLGASGILSFTDLQVHLPKAIYALAGGALWFRRNVLAEYVKQTSLALQRCVSSGERLTERERQIKELLLQQLPNRAIAQRLAISERTVKFHVSNILRKLNVESRKELCALSLSSSALAVSGLACVG